MLESSSTSKFSQNSSPVKLDTGLSAGINTSISIVDRTRGSHCKFTSRSGASNEATAEMELKQQPPSEWKP